MDEGRACRVAGMITRQEFEEQYAVRSGVTVDWLKREGKISLPCFCGEDGCQGWRMCAVRQISQFDLQFIPEPYRAEVVDRLAELTE